MTLPTTYQTPNWAPLLQPCLSLCSPSWEPPAAAYSPCLECCPHPKVHSFSAPMVFKPRSLQEQQWCCLGFGLLETAILEPHPNLLSQDLLPTKMPKGSAGADWRSCFREEAWVASTGLCSLMASTPSTHNGTSLDAHSTSMAFLRKIERETLCFALHCPGRGRSGKPKSQQKQKLLYCLALSWELLRTQKLGIPEISEGNFDCTWVSSYTVVLRPVPLPF